MGEIVSAFGEWERDAWPYAYRATVFLKSIAGGTPSDPNTAEGWIRSKIVGKEERIQQMVAEAMLERGISAEEAAAEVNRLKHLHGFKRDENGLYVEGRIIKAAIKEAASVAAGSGKLRLNKWGKTQKYIHGFVAEHIMVPDERIYLGKMEPDDIHQSFPENKRIGQRGVQMTEFCRDVTITFRVITDWHFTEKEWAMLWLTGGQEGLGACRGQGFGVYTVTEWITERQPKNAPGDEVEE